MTHYYTSFNPKYILLRQNHQLTKLLTKKYLIFSEVCDFVCFYLYFKLHGYNS